MSEGRPDYHKYLDPKVLSKVSSLELRARLVVEGFFSGMHHSPHHGASVEFADYRAYTQGDDLRHIDWKVYGKTDKYYVKEYEQETNLELMLVVDGSESMNYRSDPDGLTKYHYAVTAAAAIAFLAVQQQDSVGLTLFDSQIVQFLRPSNAAHQWRVLAAELAGHKGRAKTSIGRVLQELTERVGHRMLIILISDLFDDADDLFRGFKHLRFRRHELMIWNVWDRAELTFPFSGPTMFEGLESTGRLLAESRNLQARYLDEVKSFRNRLQVGCGQVQADLAFFDTATPLDVALSGYLSTRSARLRQRSSRILGGG